MLERSDSVFRLKSAGGACRDHRRRGRAKTFLGNAITA